MDIKSTIELAVQRYSQGNLVGSSFMLQQYVALRDSGHPSPEFMVAGRVCSGDKLAVALRALLGEKGVAA